MLASVLWPVSELAAAEFTVGRFDDPDPPVLCTETFPCSLRDAILAANANPGSDNIVVPQGVYVLSIVGRDEDANLQGDLDVIGDLVITGEGASTTIIDADGIDRVFDVRSGNTLLSGVRVTGGDAADGDGGGLRQSGGGISGGCCAALVIAASTIGSNVATGSSGGGVDNSTTLVVVGTTIEGNMVLVDDEGGGVATSAGTDYVLFQNTTFSGNLAENGGGVAIGSGNVRFVQCTFSDNSATVGDAIHNRSQVTFTSTLIDGSCAGSGTVVSQGGNLEGPGNTCSLDPGAATPDDTSVPDLGLRPLAGYGGPTRTHALKSDSPAIGSADQVTCSGTDQRRATRDGDCDSGAYEFGAVPPGPNLFADGFESGGAAAWSRAVP
jgi:CSLREA domain-containing protein